MLSKYPPYASLMSSFYGVSCRRPNQNQPGETRDQCSLTKDWSLQQDHVEYQAAQQSRATEIKSKSNKQEKNKINVVENVNRGNGITRQQKELCNDCESLTSKTWFE